MTTDLSMITEAVHSRRGLLGLMAKPLTLSTIPATQALASDDASALAEIARTEESSELLALDDSLHDVRRRLEEATARYKETIAIGRKAWPRAPEIIFAAHWHETRERDIRGEAFTHINRFGEEDQIRRCSTKDLEARKPHEPYKHRPRKPHTIAKEAADMRKRLPSIAATWQNGRSNASPPRRMRPRRTASVWHQDFPQQERTSIRSQVSCGVCEAIAKVEARTLVGLSIKASAVNAWMETEHAISLIPVARFG
jgi:hypothetical protein